MTDLARALILAALLFASACKRAGMVGPSRPSPPPLSKWRREMVLWRKPQQAELKQFIRHLRRTNSLEFSKAQARSSRATRRSAALCNTERTRLNSACRGERVNALQ